MIINERYVRTKDDKGNYYGSYSSDNDPKFHKDTNSKNNGITINVNQYRKLNKDERRQVLNHENRHKEQFNYAHSIGGNRAVNKLNDEYKLHRMTYGYHRNPFEFDANDVSTIDKIKNTTGKGKKYISTFKTHDLDRMRNYVNTVTNGSIRDRVKLYDKIKTNGDNPSSDSVLKSLTANHKIGKSIALAGGLYATKKYIDKEREKEDEITKGRANNKLKTIGITAGVGSLAAAAAMKNSLYQKKKYMEDYDKSNLGRKKYINFSMLKKRLDRGELESSKKMQRLRRKVDEYQNMHKSIMRNRRNKDYLGRGVALAATAAAGYAAHRYFKNKQDKIEAQRRAEAEKKKENKNNGIKKFFK